MTSASTGLSALTIVAIAIGATICVLLVVAIAVSIVITYCCLSRRKNSGNGEKATPAPLPPIFVMPYQYDNSGATSSLQIPSNYFTNVQHAGIYPSLPSELYSPGIPTPSHYQQPPIVSIASLTTHFPEVVPSAPPLELDLYGCETNQAMETDTEPEVQVGGCDSS